MKVRKSKWRIYQILKENTDLNINLPKTKQFNKKNLEQLLNKYKKVMLKPCRGSQGRGIIKISILPNGTFKVEFENYYFIIKKKQRLIQLLTKKIGTRKYIVQQYIPLATINKRAFDIRVMLQRSRHSKWTIWTITGKAAKVASPGYVVTNVAIKVLKVSQAIKMSSLKNKSPKKLLSKINSVSLQTIEQFTLNSNKEYSTIGLDIGIDKKGDVWVIEVNQKNPSISLFRSLKDQTIYRRIKTYKKRWKRKSKH
ncbi:YheC/YheD family protein [Salipaludibacillus sp. CF4.18]|uniref:YheC/YheD family protein n=1 Tax=Salipaludibacillus sp. CF4.18 TaxID=3373081 RepID=UPI003EE766EA